MQIGTYIKLILQKKNMTQQQLADKLQVPRQNISNIINGSMQIGALRARKIEIALDLPKYSLVELVGFPTNYRNKRRLEELG
ncbi:MAG: helix-turn-helix transcriptional regulator [Clostridia bacterium]|jgi:transcriptional regulator with XRE-family HTH domain|nr:helix-turn-helix transcriptional regulator [Clostridia bacterium]